MKALAKRVLQSVPCPPVGKLVKGLIYWRMASLPPEKALKFLFDIDSDLYSWQGAAAIRYGNGIHPKHRHLQYHDYFVDRVPEDATVIDIGCGGGHLAAKIADTTSAQVIGIEIEEKNIRQAKSLYQKENLTFTHGDALKDLPNQTFDVVILSNVLEHIEARETFLQQIQDVLKPKILLIRVPLFEREWRVPLKKELGMEWRLDTTHYTEYTYDQFEKEITAAGFHIEEQETHWGEIWGTLKAAATTKEEAA